MDPTAEFDHWRRTAPGDLGRLTGCLARQLRPDLETADIAAALDALAARCPAGTGLEICEWLAREGFGAPDGDYYEPENSMIDSVLATRRGIPITLSVVALEVARRTGATLGGVGMPGEFLLADPAVPGRWAAVFREGRILQLPEVEDLFHGLHGPATPFSTRHLAPVDATGILMRMLNNLMSIYHRRGDAPSLRWVLALRSRLAEDTPGDLRVRSELAAAEGRFDVAADLLERAARADGDEAVLLRDEARRLRARLN